MSNPIKYSTGSESLALKTGNFYIGTGDVGKGPTSTTGYYNGITPPSGGYTIYLNKATGGPSIYTCANDTELISLTNSIAGTSYTTVNECLTYFAGQTDKMVLNRDYEGIITDGLILNVDAGFTPSYPKNGTTWYNLSGNGNNGTLTNGPTFSSVNGGCLVFDGVDDYGIINHSDLTYNRSIFSVEGWIKATNYHNNYDGQLFSKWNTGGGNANEFVITVGSGVSGPGAGLIAVQDPSNSGGDNGRGSYAASALSSYVPGNWYHIVGTFDNGTLRYFRNGVLQNERDCGFTTVKTQTTVPFKIASFSEGTSFAFDGSIATVRMYSGKALTLSEVLQNYNAQKGRFGL